MAYKITKVNGNPGADISLDTSDIPENPKALYYTDDRAFAASEQNRTLNPTMLDKHFYTIGALETKIGDLYWRITSPIVIKEVIVNLGVPCDGNNITLYVQKNGGNSPQNLLYDIDIPPLSTSRSVGGDVYLEAGDYIQIDIASIGSTSPGQDMIVSFRYHNQL
jgi:hypothetical protein